MSWGIKITVLYLGFVAIILTLVFTCLGHKTELEYKDYYAKEIRFQDQINAVANADGLSKAIDFKVKERSVQIFLPKNLLSKDFSGMVFFLRPSDTSKDRTVPLFPDEEGIQMIDPGFIKGLYKMQISFKSNGKTYFKEANIFFN